MDHFTPTTIHLRSNFMFQDYDLDETITNYDEVFFNFEEKEPEDKKT